MNIRVSKLQELIKGYVSSNKQIVPHDGSNQWDTGVCILLANDAIVYQIVRLNAVKIPQK